MDKKIALENLAAITSLLDERGMPAWLDGGSLLGCHRGGDLIDHDEDTDLGIHIADWQREPALDFLQAVKAAGFAIERYFGEISQGLEICLKRRGVHTDLFFYYPEGDRVWCGSWGGNWFLARPGEPKRCVLIKYYYQRFELRPMKLKGLEFHVPADTERYLTELYGETWRIPDPAWGGLIASPNAVLTSFVEERDPTRFVEEEFLARALPRAGVSGGAPEIAAAPEAPTHLQLIEAVEKARLRRLAARKKKEAGGG